MNIKKLITRTLAELLSCERHVLLWENTSVSTAMGAKTIALSSLNDNPQSYDYIEAHFKLTTSSNTSVCVVFAPKNNNEDDYGGYAATFYTNIHNSSDPKIYYRAVRTLLNGNLYFTTGYYKTQFTTTSTSTNTAYMIPWKVYGVKKI